MLAVRRPNAFGLEGVRSGREVRARVADWSYPTRLALVGPLGLVHLMHQSNTSAAGAWRWYLTSIITDDGRWGMSPSPKATRNVLRSAGAPKGPTHRVPPKSSLGLNLP